MNDSRRHPDADELTWRRLQTEMMLTFSRVHQQILRRSQQLLEEGGIQAITPARANALVVLFQARRPLNARELARELGITEVTVSRFLRRMEEDGWVERAPDPDDGRAMLIRLTRYARDQLPQLVQVCNAVLDDVFGSLAPDELEELVATVGRVQHRLSDKTD